MWHAKGLRKQNDREGGRQVIREKKYIHTRLHSPQNALQRDTSLKKRVYSFLHTRRRSVTGTFFEASQNASSSNNAAGEPPRGLAVQHFPDTQRQAWPSLSSQPGFQAARRRCTKKRRRDSDAGDDDNGRERRCPTHGAECRREREEGVGGEVLT